MLRLAPLLLLMSASALVVACDPVHSDAVDALGGEAPNVRKGPLHRPGQPCLLCHDGALGDPPEFTVAGTIFQNPNDKAAASNATVTLTSSNGASYRATTNAAGNFYVTPNEYTPVYPMKVAVSYGGVEVAMTADVGRDGACASCHVDPAGPSSPGHVYVPEDGGTP